MQQIAAQNQCPVATSSPDAPACYWALSLDARTLLALLGAAAEYTGRVGDPDSTSWDLPARAVGGLRGLYVLAHRRNMTYDTNEHTGILHHMGGFGQTGPLPPPREDREALWRPHTHATLRSEEDLKALCNDALLRAQAKVRGHALCSTSMRLTLSHRVASIRAGGKATCTPRWCSST